MKYWIICKLIASITKDNLRKKRDNLRNNRNNNNKQMKKMNIVFQKMLQTLMKGKLNKNLIVRGKWSLLFVLLFTSVRKQI